MAHHASTFYSLKFAAIVLLSGCATATFYSRGNAENPPIADDASSQIELVNAELEVSDSREDDVTGKDNINTFPDGRVEDESNIEKDVEEASTDPPESPEEKSFLDYLSGRNVAADIPYAKELPWVGAPDPSKKAAESLFDRAEVLFATKEYSSARTQYAKAADRFPDSSVEEDLVRFLLDLVRLFCKIFSMLFWFDSLLFWIEPGSGILSKSGGCVNGSFF